MAIYLMHPLFLALFQMTPLGGRPAAAALLAIALAAATGEAIRRANLASRLL